MSQTVLEYLKNTENSPLEIHGTASTFTRSPFWHPIESITPWDDFNYDTLVGRFGGVLGQQTEAFDTVMATVEAGFHVIYDEAGLNTLVGATTILKVSKALPGDLFLAPGSRTFYHADIRPDLGAGDSTSDLVRPNGVCSPILCGDTRIGWDYERAIGMVNRSEIYEEHAERQMILPFEQIQHYCKRNKTRYWFHRYGKSPPRHSFEVVAAGSKIAETETK